MLKISSIIIGFFGWNNLNNKNDLVNKNCVTIQWNELKTSQLIIFIFAIFSQRTLGISNKQNVQNENRKEKKNYIE